MKALNLPLYLMHNDNPHNLNSIDLNHISMVEELGYEVKFMVSEHAPGRAAVIRSPNNDQAFYCSADSLQTYISGVLNGYAQAKGLWMAEFCNELIKKADLGWNSVTNSFNEGKPKHRYQDCPCCEKEYD